MNERTTSTIASTGKIDAPVSSQPGFGPTFSAFSCPTGRRSPPGSGLTFATFWRKDKLIRAPQQTRHHSSDDRDQGKHVRHANSLGLFAVFTNVQNGEERFLRKLDVTDLLHAFLTVFLLLQQLFLTADVAAVAFRRDVLRSCFTVERAMMWLPMAARIAISNC